jgi:photosystem II stability/assembly factor-like uncharacterized protein
VRPDRVALLLALALAACGGEESEPLAPAPTNAPADAPTTVPGTDAPSTGGGSPAVNSLTVDPGDGTVIIGTGPALFRLAPGESEAERVTGRVSTPQGEGAVSANLVASYAGPGELLGSGHPGEPGALPENLGLLRSRDAGDTWESVSGLGEGDYHELEAAGELIVAVNVESPDILVSRDGGRSFETRTPPAAPIDVVVDPGDAEHWAVSTEEGTFVSSDGGDSWRPRDTTPGARLVWPEEDALYSFDRNGGVHVSADGGRSFEERGDLGGLTSVVASGRKDELLAAIVGGKVLRSTDGGARWKTLTTLR